MKYKISVRPVRQKKSGYDITIEPGIFGRIPEIFGKLYNGRKLIIITDSNVQTLYGRAMKRGCERYGLETCLIDVPAGEKSKRIEVVSSLHNQLLLHGIHRDSLIVALGGGVVGDLAGFVAATILRGVEFVQVPTTLLAQVDSSVGGKVGIDHTFGKNLIGAFYQPSAVYIDPVMLGTLSAIEFRSGLAEVVKIAMALDKNFFSRLESIAGKIQKKNVTELSEIISEAVSLKKAVVEKDALERGLRTVLNLGHTIAHALEASQNYTLGHGHAVSIGLASEGMIALNLHMIRQGDYWRLLKLLRVLKLPTKFPIVQNLETFLSALSVDKKNSRDTARFVLPVGIGRAAIGVEVPSHLIHELIGIRK